MTQSTSQSLRESGLWFHELDLETLREIAGTVAIPS